jgi:hypothetical protein
MKKNIVKFIIIFSLIFNFSTPKVFSQNLDSLGRLINILGQTSNKLGGEKLEKLLLENHIIIYDYYGPLRNEIELNFNADKTYKLNGIFPHGGRAIHPSSGTWELVGLGNSYVRFNDNQNISYSNNKARFQFLFGEDGNIYEGSEKIYSFRLENKKERINRQAQVAEEKRIAEELRLKRIEEEKRQLVIKREQERIKQEEEKKRSQAEYELALKKDKEKREEEERKELYANIVKYSLLGLFLLIISFLTYKYKSKINNFYLKFINLIQELKNNIAKENKLTPNYKKIKNSSNNNSNFFRSILNKKGTPEEKYFYLLPALLSIFYIINMQILHPIFRNVFLFHYLKLGSAFIFIFNSIFIIFKNYSTSKKFNITSFLLFLIISFWSYGLLVGWERGSIKFWTILIFQTHLFLNLYLDKQFNILNVDKQFNNLNIGAVSSLFNFNFSKNKFIIVGLILFGGFIFYGINFKDNYHYNKNNSNFNTEGNLRNEAANAVNTAAACYRSLPSHAQSGAVDSMLEARKYFNDAVAYSNMDERYRSMSRPFFNNAISYSNVVMQIGKAYGSRSCG